MFLPLKSLALSGLALLFLSLPAFAQTSTIEGIVKDPDGKPLQGAVVNIERTDIKGHYTVKTDKKGHYGHYGLPMNGTYDVSVLVDGQVKDFVKNVRTSSGMPVTEDFNLKSAQAIAAGAAPAEVERNMTPAQKAEFEKQTKAREAQLASRKELNDAYTTGRTALSCALAVGHPNVLLFKEPGHTLATVTGDCPPLAEGDANGQPGPNSKAKWLDQAIEEFNKAAALDDKQVAIWSGLADAYVEGAGSKPAEAAALYDKGFDAFKKAIELSATMDPKDQASYYNNYALALAKDKKIDDAKTNLDKAAMLDPMGAGKYFYNMGALLVNGNQSDVAGEEFKKAITADPTYADAYYQYGVSLTSKATTDATGKVIAFPGTIEALRKYVELKPACAGATATQAPAGCENVAAAIGLIEQLGGTVSTTYVNPNAPQKKKK